MTGLGKWNAFYDKYRGVILIIGPALALGTALLALFATMGFGPLPTPDSRINEATTLAARAMLRVDTLRTDLDTHVQSSASVHGDMDRVIQSLKVDLCLRYPRLEDRARMQIDCETILRGRP